MLRRLGAGMFRNALLLGIVACLRTGAAPVASPAHIRAFPSGDGRLELVLDAPAFLAVGDSARLGVKRWQCHSDVCGSLASGWGGGATWSVDPKGSVAITATQHLVARHAGTVHLTTARADTTLSQFIEVLPAVATFAWEPAVVRAQVGDTIRIRAVARDSAGQIVRVIPADSHLGGEGMASLETLLWGGPFGTVVVARTPGVLDLTAHLGSRSAVFRTVVVPR